MLRMLWATLGIVACFAPLARAQQPPALTLVVLDPLAADLACPCVKGYAQRDYTALAEFLRKQIGRPVQLHFAQTLAGALKNKTAGKADLIIGKDSVIRYAAKQAKLEIEPLAALTGLDGKTTIKGLWIVHSMDKALVPNDLAGYRLIFGNEDADEKYAAGLELLKSFEVKIPENKESCDSCSTAAKKVIDGFQAGEKIAALISSYAQPLLEGCGTVQKGELRVVGETAEVPFITAFASTKLGSRERDGLREALLALGKNPELCKKLETKHGFVTRDAAKKK
ncbi:MAG: PhnD/SsuA/transferrin family substrate-binding protein [Gemmataceae bacterium]